MSQLADQVGTGLQARLDRLREGARIMVEPRSVMTRTGRPATVPVIRLGSALTLAAGPEDATTGFVTESADQLPRVGGVRFPAADGQRLRAAATRGLEGKTLGMLPLDVEGTLVRSDAAVARTIRDRIEAGGWFVWPIFFVGLLGLALSGERLWFYWKDRAQPGLREQVLSRARAGRVTDAWKAVEAGTSAEARVLRAGLQAWDQLAEAKDAALETALLLEEPRIQRSLTVIAACAAIAPLLGLLGTVTGMITTFDVITLHGTGNPRLLSGGISVALVTTQLGLVVAVPLLLLHAFLSRWAQRRGAELEAIRSAMVEKTAEVES
jgi:biopolymer transport protein ExbB